MIEREVKARIPPELEGKVESLIKTICVEEGSVQQEDIYYSHPSRNFAVTDEALRLRIEVGGGGRRVLLTYKGPRLKSDVKAREEVEVEVLSEPSKVNKLLEKLGFKKKAIVRKERRVFNCEWFRAFIDEVDELGRFIELELVSGSSDELLSVIEMLGLKSFIEPKTYLELLLEKLELES